MATPDIDHVLTMNGTIIWEALTKPDVNEKDSSLTWNLRIAVNPNAPEIAELQALVQKTLRESTKPGVSLQFPGNNPISPIDAQKFPELPGTVCFSAGTRAGQPPVYDINGAQLNPMAFSPMLYNGSVVQLLVHAYVYDNKQKGVNFGLDGVRIIDATAPRLSVGATGMAVDKVTAIMAGAMAGAAQTSPPVQQQQVQQAPPPPVQQVQQAPPPPVQQSQPAPPPPPHDSYMQQPPPPPPAAFPPAGWWPHPQAPGSFYNAANEVLTEAQLRARG